jgi:hypothetical protein
MKEKTILPFLYYVSNGVCKSNKEMPVSSEHFTGWLSASHVIRNQDRHSKRDVKACLNALREFVSSLHPAEELNQKDLEKYIKEDK